MKTYTTILATALLLFTACGDDAINGIEPTPTNFDYANWMQDLVDEFGDEVTLKKICIPRSHDAGTYLLENCSFGANACNTLTQENDMKTQLEAGVRIFDTRLKKEGDVYVTHHTTSCGGLGCNGETIKNILNQLKTFLDAHEELVILELQDLCNVSLSETSLDNLFQSILKDRLFKDDSEDGIDFINTPISEIVNDGKGKVILLYEGLFDTKEDRAKGRFGINSYIYLGGGYANTPNFQTMKADQEAKLSSFNYTRNVLYDLSWTLTLNANLSIACALNPDGQSIESNAKPANQKLGTTIDEWIASNVIKKDAFPNFITVDFSDTFVTDEAVKISRLSLE